MNWNAGGWFGSQVGATVWMLVAGVLTATRNISAGLIVVLLFGIPNVIGLALWINRKLSCYASTQILIGTSGLCGLLTVYILESANVWAQIQTGAQVPTLSTYLIIGLVFGGLMLIFYIRFGRKRNDSEA